MRSFQQHLITCGKSVKDALALLNTLAADAILFITDAEGRLLGSLTDGDVRRGFLKGLSLDSLVEEFIQPNPKFITKGAYSIEDVVKYRSSGFRIIPVLDANRVICNVVNFRFVRSYLPVDAMIMAGGRGERLRPLTDTVPKPLLEVGGKPIIEHNISRLAAFGIDDICISLRYRGEQIQKYFGDGNSMGVNLSYVWEKEALGTAGSLSLLQHMHHDTLLLMNSDLLTTIDFESFFLEFIREKADLSVACSPYQISVPYGIMEVEGGRVKGFREKPTYTYYSNAGIYLMKRAVKELIKPGTFFNATDLMELVLKNGGNVMSYPLVGYWLDIGKPEDYKKAQEDINHIKLL